VVEDHQELLEKKEKLVLKDLRAAKDSEEKLVKQVKIKDVFLY